MHTAIYNASILRNRISVMLVCTPSMPIPFVSAATERSCDTLLLFIRSGMSTYSRFCIGCNSTFVSGRSAEIQRLIGRSLRAAVDRRLLGERTITVDCDVLQGDGGTRTASVTGGFIALALACRKLVEEGVLPRTPVKHFVAGISAGIIDDAPMLDLPYSEDSRAMVDLNCVMNELGEIIELQGTGEGRAFTAAEQQELVELCAKGCRELIQKEKNILGEVL